MNKRRVWMIGLAAVMLLAVAAPVLAAEDEPPNGRIVFGDDVTLAAGESVDGDLVILGGDLVMEDGSWVEGDAVVIDGDAEIAGTVEGDLAVVNGSIRLAETAVVEGDLLVISGELYRDEGAVVLGEQLLNPANWEWHDQDWDWEWGGGVPTIPRIIPIPFDPRRIVPVPLRFEPISVSPLPWAYLRTSQIAVTTLLLAVLGGLLAVLWPQAAVRVGQTSIGAVLPALGAGLLTVIVIAALVISICLTAIGLPAGLVAGLGAVFGWLAIGNLIGDRVMASITTRTVSPFWTASLGTGLLTLVGSSLGLIPCVGWIGTFLVMCVGLGAVILTRFGTQAYPKSPSTLPVETE